MLSVIIPCFNEEKIIKNSIQRLLNWSENKNFYVEILIVNNNSTDKTQKELNDFKNIENVLIIEELNKGKKLELIGRRLKPSLNEVEENKRSRSSVMRVAMRLPRL